MNYRPGLPYVIILFVFGSIFLFYPSQKTVTIVEEVDCERGSPKINQVSGTQFHETPKPSTTLIGERTKPVIFRENPVLKTVTKTKNPFTLYVHDPKRCIYISKSILENGAWEPPKTERLTRILGDGSIQQRTFLDIGANLGWFSLVAASLGHKVISVEPLNYNIELLMASRSINANFSSLMEVHKTALSAVPSDSMCMKPAYLGNGPQNFGNGQLVPMPEDPSQCQEIVPVNTLDSIFEKHPPQERIYAIKLDIEGFETMALKGALKTLDTHKPCHISFEYIPEYVSKSGAKPGEIFEILFSRGYYIDEKNSVDDFYGNFPTENEAILKSPDCQFQPASPFRL